MKRTKSKEELEFLQDVRLLHRMTGNDGMLFHTNTINVTDCYEKVVEFFRLVQSIAIKEVYATLPLKGWKVWKFKSNARKHAENAKKTFEESIFEVMSSFHIRAETEISADNLFFGVPMRSIKECKRVIDPKFQEETRLEIVEFVESFKGKFPLDWIRE